METNKYQVDSILKNAVRLRYFQHQINSLLVKKKLKYPVHLAFGAEIFIASLMENEERIDKFFLTHRNILFNLYYTSNLLDYLDYMQDGIGLGCMNSSLFQKKIIYSSSILGNNLSVGVGSALALNFRENDKIIVADTGDGAIEEGSFWETVILARRFDVPLLITVQNNNQSMYTTISERRKGISLQKIAQSLGINYYFLSGKAKDFNSMFYKIFSGTFPAICEVGLDTFNNHHGGTPGWDEDPKSINYEDGLFLNFDNLVDPLKNEFASEAEACKLIRDIV